MHFGMVADAVRSRARCLISKPDFAILTSSSGDLSYLALLSLGFLIYKMRTILHSPLRAVAGVNVLRREYALHP